MRLWDRLQELTQRSAAEQEGVRKPDFHLRILVAMVATDTTDCTLTKISSEHGPNSLLVADKLVQIEFINVKHSTSTFPLDHPLKPHIGLLLIPNGHKPHNHVTQILQERINEYHETRHTHSRNPIAWVVAGWEHKHHIKTIKTIFMYAPNADNEGPSLIISGSVEKIMIIAIRNYLNQTFLPSDIDAQKKAFYSKKIAAATDNVLTVQRQIRREEVYVDHVNHALALLDTHVESMRNNGDPGGVISVIYSKKLALFETLLIELAPSDEQIFVDYLPEYLDCLYALTCYHNSGQPEDSIDIGSSHFTAFETILTNLEGEKNRLGILSEINARYSQKPLRFPHLTLYGELFWRRIVPWLSQENLATKLQFLQHFPYGSSFYQVFNTVTNEVIKHAETLRENDPDAACFFLSTYVDWIEDYTDNQQQEFTNNPESHVRFLLSAIKLAYYATLLTKQAILLVFNYVDALSCIPGNHSEAVLQFFTTYLIAPQKPQESLSDYHTRMAITTYVIEARQSQLISMLQPSSKLQLTTLLRTSAPYRRYKNALLFDSAAEAEIIQELKKDHLLALVLDPTLIDQIKNTNIIVDLLNLALAFYETVMYPLIEDGQIARTVLSDIVPPILLDYLEWAVHVVYPTEDERKITKPSFSLPAHLAGQPTAEIDKLAHNLAAFMVMYCPATMLLNHYIRFSKMRVKEYQFASMSDFMARNKGLPALGMIHISNRLEYCVQDRNRIPDWGALPELMLAGICPEGRIKRRNGQVKIANFNDLLDNTQFKSRVITHLTEQGVLFPIPLDPGSRVCDFLYAALMNPRQLAEDDEAYRTRRAVIFFVHSELNYMPELRWNHLHALMRAEQDSLPASIPRIDDDYQGVFVENKEVYLNDPRNVPPALYLLARYRVAKLIAAFGQSSPQQESLDSYHRLYRYTFDSYFFITDLIKDTLRFFTSHLDRDSQAIASTIVQDYVPLLRTLLKISVDFFSQQERSALFPHTTLRNSAALQHLIDDMPNDHLLALIHYFGDLTLKFRESTISLTWFILCETKLLRDLLLNKDFDPLRALLKTYRSHAQTHDREMTIDWSKGPNNIYLLAFQAGADAKFLTLMIDAGCPLGDLSKERLKAACEGNKTDTYYFLNAHVKFNQPRQPTPASKITLGFDSKKSSAEDNEDLSDQDRDDDPFLLGRRVFPLPFN